MPALAETGEPVPPNAPRGIDWAETLRGNTAENRYALLGPVFSYHQSRTQNGRPFNERNMGLGIASRAPLANYPFLERTWTASILNDSFYSSALFATYSVTEQLGALGGLELRAGIITGLTYKRLKWDEPRYLVPLLGPKISLVHKPSGLGLELFYQYQPNNPQGKPNGIFMLQTSVEF